LESGRPPVAVLAELFAARVGGTGESDNGALRDAAFFAAAGFFPLPGALRVDRLASSSFAFFAIGLTRLLQVIFASARQLGRARTDVAFRCSNA
jgi:hypothetical protein